MEVSLSFVAPWCAYYTAEALELSGIVAIMMAGIVMALFMRHSLSDEAAKISSALYKVIATIAETYVFVYLGIAFIAFPIFAHLDLNLVVVALGACLCRHALAKLTHLHLTANQIDDVGVDALNGAAASGAISANAASSGAA